MKMDQSPEGSPGDRLWCDQPPRLTELAVLLHPGDCVAVAARPLQAGQKLLLQDGGLLRLEDPIPAGHKFALRAISTDEVVTKYGEAIGRATQPIRPGQHVHTHNLAGIKPAAWLDGAATGPAAPGFPCGAGQPGEQQRDRPGGARPSGGRTRPGLTFRGYLRPDGRVGTRNYVAVIASVNCSASIARAVAERFRDVGRTYPEVDGVIALTHKAGCAVPRDSEDLAMLRRTLVGFARHPNIGAAVFIGLGCEVNQLDGLARCYAQTEAGCPISQPADPSDAGPSTVAGSVGAGSGPVRPAPQFLNIQQLGGTTRTIEAAISAVRELLPRVNESVRTDQPVGRLVVGVQCGGSDAYSGITANPAALLATER